MFDTEENNDYLIDFRFDNRNAVFDGLRLYQVGKKFCNEQTVVNYHTHINWFELTVAIEGKGKIYNDDDFIKIANGDIFLSFPGDMHKIESDGNSPLKYAFLSFCLENDKYKDVYAKITREFYECKKRVFKNNTVTVLIDSLISELIADEYDKEDVITHVLHQIVILSCRAFLCHGQETNALNIGKNEIMCYKIMRYIDNNVFIIKNLTELSEYFNYNYSYLAKIFKNTTKSTISEYLSKKKLERAKALISEGNFSFTQISEILNYSSIYSFSKSFKLRYGISPTEYKKNIIC